MKLVTGVSTKTNLCSTKNMTGKSIQTDPSIVKARGKNLMALWPLSRDRERSTTGWYRKSLTACGRATQSAIKTLLWSGVAFATIPSVAKDATSKGEENSRVIAQGPSEKSCSRIVSRQMRANAVRNCDRYAWARKYRDDLIAEMRPFMEMSDEVLWSQLSSHEMPRDTLVNFHGKGCPNCGDKQRAAVGTLWRVELFKRPWQVQCNHCQQWFPSNDFAAYYSSALDDEGKFCLGRGDKQYLQPRDASDNVECVEDGTGVHIGDQKWFFAAYYASQVWWTLTDAARKLAILYTLTDDPAYAHKVGILLDRMADLYPEMDYQRWHAMGMEASTGGSGKGRVMGRISECDIANRVCRAYDLAFDALQSDEELVNFSSRMSAKHRTGRKDSARAIIDHIENHLIKEFILSVLDHRIAGNEGMTQHAMAAAAIALDHPILTPRFLDWLFEPDGGRVPYLLTEFIGRDGLSVESGLEYAIIPGESMYVVAELLRQYGLYSRHDIYRDFPKFRNCFTMYNKVRAADRHSPLWGDTVGDSKKCMGIHLLKAPVEMALAGYRVYGGSDIAREVWYSNGRSLNGLRLDIYDSEPEAIVEKLRADVVNVEPADLRSYNSGGYGSAFLQAPSRDNARCIMLNYGRMIYHGHEDRLAIQMLANDSVGIVDLGYPLYTGAWPERLGWTSHIVSHNTCMVNDKGPKREGSFSGKTQLFSELPGVRVIDVDGEGPGIYSGVRTYRRCLAMVDVDEANSYTLDLFWVRGGKNHRLIQNGGGPEVTQQGLELTAQVNGTYAGENVGYGQFYDGPSDSQYDGSGFMYLNRVEKAYPQQDFWVDWKIVDPRRVEPPQAEPHVRVHNLTAVDEVALCDGAPPARHGNPTTLRYMLRSRFGEDLTTQFVSIIEPYAGAPIIRSVRVLQNDADSANCVAAIEIELVDGRRDVVLVAENSTEVNAGGVQMQGRVGFVRFDRTTGPGNAQPISARLLDGTSLKAGPVELSLSAPAITGALLSADESDPTNTLLKLSDAIETDRIVGKYIIFDNKERSDASYRIERVIDPHTISIGAYSLAERLRDTTDYSRGIINNIAPGETFRISLDAEWERK